MPGKWLTENTASTDHYTVEIDYKKSAVTDEALCIRTWPLNKGAVSGLLDQEGRQAEPPPQWDRPA